MKNLIPIVGLLFAVSAFAQETKKAVLVDEFGKMNCEEVSARSDIFVQSLKTSTDTGIAIFYPEKKYPHRSGFYERQLIYSLYANNLSRQRVRIIHGETRDQEKTEFWKVPDGSKEPQFNEASRSDTLSVSTKPYIFDINVDDGVCHMFVPAIYADFIAANPNVRGHIVVRNSDKRNRRKSALEWLKIFTKDLGVPRNRLRIYYSEERRMPYTEFWIVPNIR